MKLCFVTVEKHPDVTVGRSKMQILFCFCIRSLYQHNQHVRVLFSTALDNIFTWMLSLILHGLNKAINDNYSLHGHLSMYMFAILGNVYEY